MTRQQLKLLRYQDLVDLRIISNRVTLRRWMERNGFPRPLRLGSNSIAWKAVEVQEWLDQKSARRQDPMKVL